MSQKHLQRLKHNTIKSMKKVIFSLLIFTLCLNFSFCQEKKGYYTSKFEFENRAELVKLVDKVISETDISDFKNSIENVQDIELTIGDNVLIYNPISNSTMNDENAPCPPGFTNHGTFTDEQKIKDKVGEIAAPVANCCPKVTIILDRGTFGVRICSKTEK